MGKRRELESLLGYIIVRYSAMIMDFAFDIVTVRHIIISLMIGFMLGLQRDISHYQHKRNGFAGARTFAMIALMGCLSAWLNQEIEFFCIGLFFDSGKFCTAFLTTLML